MQASIVILFFLFLFGKSEVNFVAGGFDSGSGGGTMAWSQDGLAWTPVLSSPFLSSCNGIGYSSSQRKWLALGSGTNTMAYSLDGKNWVGMGSTVFPTQGNRIHYSASQDRWIATGSGANNIAYSQDGVGWNYATTVFTTEANDIVHAPGLGIWVAVGAGTNNIAHSPDGITWTGLGLSIFGFGGKGLSIDFEPSNNQFIAGGVSASFPYGVSTDGVTWSGRAGLFSNQVKDAAYGQGQWIITGPATPLPTPFANSSDAVSGSWTLCQPQTSIANGQGLVYHPQYDRWVAIGSGSNSAVYSSNGVDWIGTGSPFQTAGFHVATTGTFLVLPPNQLNGIFAGTILTNSSTIFSNSTVLLQGSLTVAGDLYVLGSLTVDINAALNTTETITVNGNLIFQVAVASSNSSGSIQSRVLLVDGADLTLALVDPLVQDITVVVAQYTGSAGTFRSVNVLALHSEQQCLTQTPQYGASTLSVTVAITTCPVTDASTQTPGGNTRSAGFPIWAIVLVVVLVALIGVGIAIGIAFLTRRRNRTLTRVAMADIRKKEIERMQSMSNVVRSDSLPE
jgi:hypothetical protein